MRCLQRGKKKREKKNKYVHSKEENKDKQCNGKIIFRTNRNIRMIEKRKVKFKIEKISNVSHQLFAFIRSSNTLSEWSNEINKKISLETLIS